MRRAAAVGMDPERPDARGRKEETMKLVLRAATALALLGLATPALPCGDKAMKTTTASASEAKGKDQAAKSAKQADAKAAKDSQQKVAKSGN